MEHNGKGSYAGRSGTAGAAVRLLKSPSKTQEVVKEKRMELKVLEILVADGSPEECSEFAFRLLNYLKWQTDREKRQEAKAEALAIEKALNMTFDELMKKEQEREKEE